MFKVKKLKINGFKSFAFPCEIEIGEGVTGIVGPNGCGKSNIFESLRWVMGESSSKSLRSISMDEVIFSGTEKIPAKNFAEVVIELENIAKNETNKLLNEENLIVSRILERGVGSFYKINNKEVRAKDILTLFSDSGSGPRSSSIISQGNIDQIINYKPIERKIILEDAAGISGLQSRRHESELKLNATENNLDRLNDTISNLENQQKSLKRQARQAENYSLISEKIKSNEAMLFYQDWSSINKEFLESEKKFFKIESELSNTEKELETLEENKELQINITNKEERQINLLNMELQLKSSEKNKLLNKKELYENRKKEIIFYLDSIKNDKEIEKKKLIEFEKGVNENKKNIQEFENILPLKKFLQKEKTEEILLQEKLKELESQLVSEMQLILGEEFKYDNLKSSKNNLSIKRENIKKQISDTKALLTKSDEINYKKDILYIEKEKKYFEEKRDKLKTINDQINQNKKDLLEKLSFSNSEIQILTEEFTQKSTELLTLKKLFKDKNLSTKSIFNLLKVKKGFESTVYAALKDELDAELSQSKKRWVKVSKKEIKEIPDSLIKLVEAPPELNSILSQISYVTNNEQGYARQQKLKVGQMIVGKDGTLWRWDGFVSEKSNETEKWLDYKTRILEIEPVIFELDKKLIRLKKDKKKIETLIDKENILESKNKKETENIYEKLNLFNIKLSKVKEKDSVKITTFEKLNEKIKYLNTELLLIDVELKKIFDSQKKNDLQIKNKNKAESNKIEVLIEKIKSRIIKKRKEISELNENILSQEINFKYITNELEQNEKRRIECIERVKTYNLREKKYLDEEKQLQKLPEDLEKNISKLDIIAAKLSSDINKKNTEVENERNKQKKIEKNIREVANKKEVLKDNFIRTEEHIIYLKEKKHNIKEVIFQRIKCNPEEIKEKIGFDEAELKATDELKKSLEKLSFQREQMGPVNLRAYIEEKEITEQLNSIELEKNDLTQAIHKLRTAINKINIEGKKKLVDAFELVNTNFSQLFKQFFDGGEASLKLVNSDDPLQTGLEIYAKPPGKKLTNISLLSGGEKTLTAISLIFSIFLINPSPICVLDEVDAALDDFNVEKFCDLLTEIKNKTKTKFLIISHHKTTMAMVDRVYGITMTQKGISDIVSVDFNKEKFKKAV